MVPKISKWCLAAVLAAGGSGSLLAAQNPASSDFKASANVSLVEVPANVIGHDGNPVPGLTAADFRVFDGGKLQKILACDVVDLNQAKLAPGLAALPAVGRRHFLLLFDFSYATPNEIVRSRQAAATFLTRGMEPEDLAAVAFISAEQGARVLVNFTSDRRQLLAAIAALGLPKSNTQTRDPLAFAFALPGDPEMNKLMPTDILVPHGSEGLQAEMAQNIKLLGLLARETSDKFSIQRVSRQLQGMGSLATALDMVDGRKIVVYFSEGFDNRLLTGEINKDPLKAEEENNEMFSGQSYAVDVDRRYANGPLQETLDQTLAFFRRSDCTVYPVDIAGLMPEGNATLGAGGRGEAFLFQLASETGGEVINNSNDIENQLARIARQTSLTYVLSFEPSFSYGSGKFHELKVKVDRKGVRVSARAGYYEEQDFRALSPLARMLSAANVVMSQKSAGKIPLSVMALPLVAPRMDTVPVLLNIAPAFFRARSESNRLNIGLYVYVTDSSGQLADYFTRAVSVNLALQGSGLVSGGLTYWGVCHVLPGNYLVRAYVRDEDTGSFGYQTFPILAPHFGAEPLAPLPPVFLTSTVEGLHLKDSGEAAGAGDPFDLGNHAYVPEVSPSLSSGSHSRLCVLIFQKADAPRILPFEISAQVVGDAGQVRQPAKLALLGRSPPGANGLVRLLLDFDSAGLPAGSYRLEMTFHGVKDGKPPVTSVSQFQIS